MKLIILQIIKHLVHIQQHLLEIIIVILQLMEMEMEKQKFIYLNLKLVQQHVVVAHLVFHHVI